MHMKMNRATLPGYPLAAFCLLAFVAEPAPAQITITVDCKPVVYVFRHAEDYTPTNIADGPYGRLTNTGAKHAVLYPALIENFQNADGNTFCPVTKVYSSNPSKGGSADALNLDGADNAFCTARPLALALNPKQTGTLPSKLPANKNAMCNDGGVPLTVNDPIIYLSASRLEEFLGNPVPDPATNTSSNPYAASYTKPEATALRTTLIATATTKTTTSTSTTITTYSGQSSAIFWTSQGLHVLGGAIISADSRVPQKSFGTAVFKAGTPMGTPQRNAAYIFPYNSGKVGFDDVLKFDQYVQCYNWTLTSPDAAGDFRTDYWCGRINYADLGGKPQDNVGPKGGSKISDANLGCVRAKICDTTKLTPNTASAAFYGSCPSGVPKVNLAAC